MYIFTITRYSRRHLKTDIIFLYGQSEFFADMNLLGQSYRKLPLKVDKHCTCLLDTISVKSVLSFD